MKKSAHHTEKLRKQIDELAASGKLRSISDQAVELHPSDLADLIESLDEQYRVEILCMLPTILPSETLSEMDEGEGRAELLVALPADKVAEFLKELADDDATDLIGELGPEDQRRVLAALPVDEAGDIKRLLSYGEETAGGLMTTELVEVEGSLQADEAIRQVRIQGRDVEDFYTVFVIDEKRRLLGTMRLDDLVVADPTASIEGLVEEPSVTVSPDIDQEEVGRLLGRYNLAAIPVVTDEGMLLGRITFDDVIDVIESEQTEDILMLAGVPDEDELRHNWIESVTTRLPWLMLNLATAAMAASVILVFKDLIEKELTLAFIAPIIAALGGSSGTQSLAVTIRRITVQGSGSARGFVA